MATKAKKKNPRLASGRKRVRQDVKINAANTSLRSKYRTAVKKSHCRFCNRSVRGGLGC
jgi:small subunit ribosomal protein S20